MGKPDAFDQPGKSPSQPTDAVFSGSECKDFAALFGQSYRILWLISVAATKDRSIAEDVVQDAAIIALKKFDQFTSGTNFTAWMSKIVRNVASNRARSERRRRRFFREKGAAVHPSGFPGRVQHAPSDGGSGQPEVADFDVRVLKALDGLGEVARACLLLKTVEGMSYGEICRLIEIPEGTAMSHVHRSRRYLRERLEGAWREQERAVVNASPNPNPQASRELPSKKKPDGPG